MHPPGDTLFPPSLFPSSSSSVRPLILDGGEGRVRWSRGRQQREGGNPRQRPRPRLYHRVLQEKQIGFCPRNNSFFLHFKLNYLVISSVICICFGLTHCRVDNEEGGESCRAPSRNLDSFLDRKWIASAVRAGAVPPKKTRGLNFRQPTMR